MQKQILDELKEIKSAIAKLTGNPGSAQKDQFSIEALENAAKTIKRLERQRAEWISESDIDKYIKNAGYRAGDLIRQEFGFTNFFKQGRNYYFNKKDLIA